MTWPTLGEVNKSGKREMEMESWDLSRGGA